MQRKSTDEIINRLGIVVTKAEIDGKERLHANFVQQENKKLLGTQREQLKQYKRMILGDTVCVIMAAYCEMEPVINEGNISFENWLQQTKDSLVELRDMGLNDVEIPTQRLKPEDFKFSSQIEIVVYNDITAQKHYTVNLVPDEAKGYQRTREDHEFNVQTILIGLSGLFRRLHQDGIRYYDDCLSDMEQFLPLYRNNQLSAGTKIFLISGEK
jgi:hypothetical protein